MSSLISSPVYLIGASGKEAEFCVEAHIRNEVRACFDREIGRESGRFVKKRFSNINKPNSLILV